MVWSSASFKALAAVAGETRWKPDWIFPQWNTEDGLCLVAPACWGKESMLPGHFQFPYSLCPYGAFYLRKTFTSATSHLTLRGSCYNPLFSAEIKKKKGVGSHCNVESGPWNLWDCSLKPAQVCTDTKPSLRTVFYLKISACPTCSGQSRFYKVILSLNEWVCILVSTKTKRTTEDKTVEWFIAYRKGGAGGIFPKQRSLPRTES